MPRRTKAPTTQRKNPAPAPTTQKNNWILPLVGILALIMIGSSPYWLNMLLKTFFGTTPKAATDPACDINLSDFERLMNNIQRHFDISSEAFLEFLSLKKPLCNKDSSHPSSLLPCSTHTILSTIDPDTSHKTRLSNINRESIALPPKVLWRYRETIKGLKYILDYHNKILPALTGAQMTLPEYLRALFTDLKTNLPNTQHNDQSARELHRVQIQMIAGAPFDEEHTYQTMAYAHMLLQQITEMLKERCPKQQSAQEQQLLFTPINWSIEACAAIVILAVGAYLIYRSTQSSSQQAGSNTRVRPTRRSTSRVLPSGQDPHTNQHDTAAEGGSLERGPASR